MSSVAKKSDLEPLNNHDYCTWAPDISCRLSEAPLFRIIKGKAYVPDKSAHPFEYEKYLNNVDSAAGMIFNALDHDQEVYVLRGHCKGVSKSSERQGTRLESDVINYV
jgi:hypothetical protein